MYLVVPAIKCARQSNFFGVWIAFERKLCRTLQAWNDEQRIGMPCAVVGGERMCGVGYPRAVDDKLIGVFSGL